MNYVPFHIHSDYSLLDSCTQYQDYINLAVEQGCKALAFSEHGKPLGWISKKIACDEAGIRYIHGVEIYLTESLEEKVRDNFHTVLLCRNHQGVLELNRLVSKSCNPDHFYYVNRLSFDEFLEISDNIISTSACLASPLNKLPEDHPMYDRLIAKYDFLEVQPHTHPDQIEYNKRLLRLAKKHNKPLIAGMDTHNSSQYKAECRIILLESKRKNYTDEDSFDLTWKTYDELVTAFSKQNAIPEKKYRQAIENTNLLYDMTEDFELDRSIKYPILYGSPETDAQKLKELTEQKLTEKIATGVIPAEQETRFREAVKEEMRVFDKVGMSGFMLSTSEIISWCKEQGMAFGMARGSVGGSRVAYLTDIIDLNPETWETVFSRFCNEDRVEIGDVDVDCSEEDRPLIFNHIISKFGADKTARVAAFGTILDRKAIDDIGRCLRERWKAANPDSLDENPYSIAKLKEIKKAYADYDPGIREKYPEIFYYFDGLVGTKVSQSVHPAGMIISPITLADNYGVFDKDGELCLMMDMDEAHEVGVAKYDFLVLKTVKVIKDACHAAGVPYPKTHEVNWDDRDVWESLGKDPTGAFQFESDFAQTCLKRFKPKSIYEMSLVTAAIRPSGASYRDRLLARIPNETPSEIIDKLLEKNNKFLCYQEDTLKFLQEVCGLSGSEADNVRRAIGRKDKERLAKALPQILDGYCSKSPKSRAEAEIEVEEFLRIIEDSANYQFGYNHSVAYCLLGYLCAYYRHYYPHEYITSYLNNAANEDDIVAGTKLAKNYGIKVDLPKWGISRGGYSFSKDKGIIAKGLSSVKYLSITLANELYVLSQKKQYIYFTDLLRDIHQETSADIRQLNVLVSIDFFSEFGNQRELLRIADKFYYFKRGEAKQIKKVDVEGSQIEEIIKRYSVGVKKSGGEAKSYKLLDVMAILMEVELEVKAAQIEDLDIRTKMKNFHEAMGYAAYVSGKQEDRRHLLISDMWPLHRKRDGEFFGYSIVTKSIGSGKEARFTVFEKTYAKSPIKKGDIIVCKDYERRGQYFTLTAYEKAI